MPHIGFNVNNREPLLNPEFTPADMIDIGVRAEELGFDSVWVGDNLLEKPRLEPVATLATLAAKTESVQLGTACMITTLRNPVQFAQAWATLDLLSDGRMVLGACMGTPDDMNLKQHDIVGIPPKQRHKALEEGIEIMKALWTEGTVDYDGEIYEFDDVSFDTGRETIPLRPEQDDPPVLVISNPSLHGNPAVLERAIRRIVEIGDGWMTANRAHRPDEYEEQYAAIVEHAEEVGVDPEELQTAYQITFNINESREQAEREMKRYLSTYYGIEDPNYDSWGPVGTPDDVIEWIDDFHERGCDIFITRFGADDHWEQLERLANEVLPSFR
ncbi:MAG: LLM class flavin-dependent oxidoreductase [Halobacteriales archaeon]